MRNIQKKTTSYICFFISVFALCQCTQVKENPLFKLLPAADSGIDFSNNIAHEEDFTILDYMYFYNGGGVAIGDINQDGLEDIFFAGNQVSSRLYLNLGDLKFKDITSSAKVGTSSWASGVSMVDINQDGWLDIYVCQTASPVADKRKNLLFVNNGDATFSEQAATYGLADSSYSTQAAFFDYDRDGDLDMYLLNHTHQFKGTNNPLPRKVEGQANNMDKLFRNDKDAGGKIFFTDVSREAGILIEGFGLGVAVADLNKDQWPDIYISNDFISNDLMYINNQDGTFTNKINASLKHQSHNGMGNDVADFNNDEWADIFVADMFPRTNKRRKRMAMNTGYDLFNAMLQMDYEPQYTRNTLQLNNGLSDRLSFSEIGQLAGIHATDWSWSSLFADFDNDGWKDLFVTTGHLKDLTDLDFIDYRKKRMIFNTPAARDSLYLELLKDLPGIKETNYFFKNTKDLTFANATSAYIGDRPTFSNGASYADLDNDGDLDLVISNLNEPAFLYENQSETHFEEAPHYLQIKLKGTPENRQGIGTKIALYTQNGPQYYEHFLSRGYLSSISEKICFGLGNQTRSDSIILTWPDGKKQVLKNVSGDQLLEIDWQDATSPTNKTNTTQPIFVENTSSLQANFQHREWDFADFKFERLIPHKYSNNGPGIAVGDINGDGLDDFFVGGSAGYSGQFFIQNTSGGFEQTAFSSDAEFEDLGVLFFDSDQDGDLDLYIVSGGSEAWGHPAKFQDRLYRNNGLGEFTRDHAALPEMISSGSCVNACDFDRDGDLDLFVGGRIKPGQYPATPSSYLLENRGAKFVDVTKEKAPQLRSVGMVSAALWTDFNNDAQMDLMVVGEWMPLTFFQNKGGVLQRISPEITNSTSKNVQTNGWWNSLAGGDFDQDGDIDYVLGNLGENSDFKASQDQPVSLYAGYFDANKSWDAILCNYQPAENGVYASFPIHTRNEIIDQMNSLKKNFVDYSDYATAKIEDIIDAEKLTEAEIFKAYYFQSAYLENRGNGQFVIKPLPVEAQFSPVYGMQVQDVDHDGFLDLLCVGNFYGPIIRIGRYDASIGLLLKGDGKGHFKPISPAKSGFYADGDTKALSLILIAGKPHYIVSRNNADLALFSYTKEFKAKVIPSKNTDHFAELRFGEGIKRKEEFYHGSGYLSQSSRVLIIPETVKDYKIIRNEIN